MTEDSFYISGVKIDRNTTVEDLRKTGLFRIEEGKSHVYVCSNFGQTVTFHESPCLTEMTFDREGLADIRLDLRDPERFEGLTEPSAEFQWKEWSCWLELMRRHYGEPDVFEKDVFVYEFNRGYVASELIMEGREPYTGGYLRIVFKRDWEI